MDDALAGTRVLIAGGEPDAAKALGAALAAGAAQVTVAPDAEAAAQAALAGPPDVIVAIGTAERELRDLLDPLELRSGPPLVARLRRSTAEERATPPCGCALLLDRAALERRARDLESRARRRRPSARRRDLEAARIEMLRRLALAAEYRDDNTREHTERVAALAARLGQRLGLSELALTHIRHAAPLHDVGKIAIPDSILLKPGRLSDAEFEVVKTHAEAGARVLADADSELLEVAESIARSHHERWDGTGYPDGARRAPTSRSWGGSCTSPTCSTSSSTSAPTRRRSASRTPPRRSRAAPARSSIPRSSRRSPTSARASGWPRPASTAAETPPQVSRRRRAIRGV